MDMSFLGQVLTIWAAMSIIVIGIYLACTNARYFDEIYVGHIILAIICLPVTLVMLTIYLIVKLCMIKIK